MLSFFPLNVLDEIWDVIESVFEGFLTYYSIVKALKQFARRIPTWTLVCGPSFSCHMRDDQEGFTHIMGWSGDAMVLGKLPVPGRPTVSITVGQGPTALAVGAGGGCLDIFTLIYPFSPLSPSL